MRTYHLRAVNYFIIHSWMEYLLDEFIYGRIGCLYTVAGGTRAVSITAQMQQMAVILVGMVAAGFMVVHLLPEIFHSENLLNLAGKWENWMWSFFLDLKKSSVQCLVRLDWRAFLMLSYFGTDQSQVGRYLSGKVWDKADSVCCSTAWSKYQCNSAYYWSDIALCVLSNFSNRRCISTMWK